MPLPSGTQSWSWATSSSTAAATSSRGRGDIASRAAGASNRPGAGGVAGSGDATLRRTRP
jgi:hypothetical protein